VEVIARFTPGPTQTRPHRVHRAKLREPGNSRQNRPCAARHRKDFTNLCETCVFLVGYDHTGSRDDR